MPAPIIQIKRGSINELTGLALAEPGFTTDTSELYIGLDGTLSGNKFFGSSRYWGKENFSNSSSVKLYESTSNGSNFVGLKAPQNIPLNINYILPASPIDGYFLKTDSLGTLYWSNELNNVTLTGTVEISSLWVNDCAGRSEVIACSGSERTLENITIDCGFY